MNPFLLRATCVAMLLAAGLAELARAQAPAGMPPNPYAVDESFALEMPAGLKTLGATVGARIAPDGSLYVFHRCVENSCAAHPTVPPLLKYSPAGKLLASMAAGMFVWPHALFIDPQGNIWLSDAVAPEGVNPDAPGRGHQVFKLRADGQVLLALGKPGVAGSGRDTFFAPSDVVVDRDGFVFVADGHGGATNNRVVKFSAEGKYVKEWGGYGRGRGEFRLPHTIAMDSRGRIFVGDRPNNRIQIFDREGNFLEEWKQFGRPSAIHIDDNDIIYVTDTQTTDGRPGFRNGIYIGSVRDGKVTGFIPKVDERSNMEGIGSSPDGSVLYGADIGLNKVVKFVRK